MLTVTVLRSCNEQAMTLCLRMSNLHESEASSKSPTNVWLGQRQLLKGLRRWRNMLDVGPQLHPRRSLWRVFTQDGVFRIRRPQSSTPPRSVVDQQHRPNGCFEVGKLVAVGPDAGDDFPSHDTASCVAAAISGIDHPVPPASRLRARRRQPSRDSHLW